MSPKCVLVVLALMASIPQTEATCNLLAAKFRLLGCAFSRRFPCSLIDFKMNLLNCRLFACEGYRDLDTFCAFSCRGELQISNGMCRIGTRCCLDGSAATDSGSFPLDDDLVRIPGSAAYELLTNNKQQKENQNLSESNDLALLGIDKPEPKDNGDA